MPLDPGWLARDLDEAASDLAASCSPAMVPEVMRPPLDPADADRLRDKLATRYHEWTGRDLAADLAASADRKDVDA